MRSVSVLQLIVLVIVCFLLFGDLPTLKKKFKIFFKKINNK